MYGWPVKYPLVFNKSSFLQVCYKTVFTSYIHTMNINTPTFIVRLLQPKLVSDHRGPSASSLSGDSRFCGEKVAAVAAPVGVLFAWFWEKLDELNMLTWARDRRGRGGHDLE